MSAVLCRDCSALAASRRCRRRRPAARNAARRGSSRTPNWRDLALAHLDCDAFYATVEKRGRPELADRPVIVGGGARGVVLACCYVARLYGVRSAMPMFKALAACPDAVVIRPDMAKYREVGRAVRAEMRRLTPLVEPLSIDEAFLDLSGTAAVHGVAPAQALAALARRVETALGITVSIGLSYNKFLAKLASDLDKPRGFAVIGRQPRRPGFSPTSRSTGCGGSAARCSAGSPPTASCGSGSCAALDRRDLAHRYGRLGLRLAELASRRGFAPRPARGARPLDLGRDHVCPRRGRRGGAGAGAAARCASSWRRV